MLNTWLDGRRSENEKLTRIRRPKDGEQREEGKELIKLDMSKIVIFYCMFLG
jgi:hypothetical protein